MRVLVCVALVLLACAAPAVAADPARLGHDDPAGLRAEAAAAEIMTEAGLELSDRRPDCNMHRSISRPGEVPITDAEPSLAVRSVIGLFRRPPTPEEQALAAAPTRAMVFPGTLERSRQGVRVAHTASGEEVVVTVLPRVDRLGYDAVLHQECTELQREIANRLARRAPARVRQEVRYALEELPDAGAGAVAEPQVAEAVTLAWRNGASGGLFDTQRFSVTGTFISLERSAIAKRGVRSRLVGLVPDGVATVELRYPRYVSRGRHRNPFDYGRRHTRTVRVQENVFAVTVPRDAGDVFPPTMVWRSAAGTVVRKVERGE